MQLAAVANFAANLCELLKHRKLTQDSLAEAVGLSRPHVNRILNGKNEPSVNTCERIANFVKVPLPILLGPSAEFRRYLKSTVAAE